LESLFIPQKYLPNRLKSTYQIIQKAYTFYLLRSMANQKHLRF